MRDRRLVQRLQRGDVEALQQIYHRYKEDLLTVAMFLLGEVHTAEDCVHDVFVHFAEAPADLQQGTAKVWVGTKELLPLRLEAYMLLGKTIATFFTDVRCHEIAVLDKYNIELDPGSFETRTPEGCTEFKLTDLFPGMFGRKL